MDLALKGKIIIVTGGSKGIGYGICACLVKEGAIPIIVGRNKQTIIQAVETLSQKEIAVGHVFAELTDPKQCQAAVDTVIKEYGQIDGLVNNAGVNNSIGLESGSHQAFTESIQRNITHY